MDIDIVEEVEEKTYNLKFESGEFIFTDNATHRSGPISVEVARANSNQIDVCLLYTSPSPRDRQKSRMPSSA